VTSRHEKGEFIMTTGQVETALDVADYLVDSRAGLPAAPVAQSDRIGVVRCIRRLKSDGILDNIKNIFCIKPHNRLATD
jgi:hypothetical protein